MYHPGAALKVEGCTVTSNSFVFCDLNVVDFLCLNCRMRKDRRIQLRRKRRYQLHREALLAKRKTYYLQNREKILAAQRERYVYRPKKKNLIFSERPCTPPKEPRSYKPKKKKVISSKRPSSLQPKRPAVSTAKPSNKKFQATDEKEWYESRQPYTPTTTVSAQTETSKTESCQSEEFLIPLVNKCTSERKGMCVYVTSCRA